MASSLLSGVFTLGDLVRSVAARRWGMRFTVWTTPLHHWLAVPGERALAEWPLAAMLQRWRGQPLSHASLRSRGTGAGGWAGSPRSCASPPAA